MEKEKNTMMRDGMLSIMALDFFSKRFNIREEFLSWGVQRLTTEESTSYEPVVLVNGNEMFIDIRKDCCSPRSSIYGRTAELLPAVMKETEEAYIFSAEEGAQYVLTKDDLRALYERKVLC